MVDSPVVAQEDVHGVVVIRAPDPQSSLDARPGIGMLVGTRFPELSFVAGMISM